jgi:UDP-glucose 4-epimerase
MSATMLLTGAAGFIGRHVAEEASRRGYRVTGVDRNGVSIPGLDVVKADIRDRDRLVDLASGKDYVVHLAAITSNVEFMKDPAGCHDVNVTGFINVIDAAVRGGCQRFVYASSAAVYMDAFAEDAVVDVAVQANHYAKSKIMNEMTARSYEAIHGLSTVGLRYFNVYGRGENAKGEYASIVTLFLKSRRRGDRLVVYGDGTQARDLIHVTDAARLTVDLLEKGSYDVYNVGTGVATTYRTIAELIDRDHIECVPNPLASYQHYTRADTRRLEETLGRYHVIDLATGIRDLGSTENR